MSWSSRLSRFSPFGRSSAASTSVDDSDFSYITPSDLDAHLSRPKRDTDVLLFRHKKVSYPVHFPAYSIDDGKLTIGTARDAAAKKLSADGGSTTLDPRRVRMFWKGRNLKDDARSVRDEGLSSAAQAEILCVIGEPVTSTSTSTSTSTPGEALDDDDADSESDADDGTSTPNGTPAAPKRKRNRSRKKKKGGAKSTGTSTPTTPGALPGGGVPLPPSTPLTPQAKMAAIAAHFHTALLPLCEAYVARPPVDPGKREQEHRRLTETTLQQVLLKLDGVETEGLEEARTMRKELVREVQGWLNRMDGVVKGDA